MTNSTLTADQQQLLQRWFDGELDGSEARRAQQLVDSSEAAQTYVSSLEETRGSVRAAFEEAGASVQMPEPGSIVEAAAAAAPIVEEDLGELAPLLERYYDDEVTEAERAVVRRLRRRREDVQAYLERLEELGGAVRAADEAAREDVTFDELWADIDASIDVDFDADSDVTDGAVPDFEPETHAEWLHRYVDGELSGERRSVVEAWRDAGQAQVEDTLAALRESGDAVRAARDEAVASADFDGFWEAVDAGIASEADNAEAVPTFAPEKHAEWLHRYVDGELSDERRAIVETWRETGHQQVEETLAALREGGDAVRAARDEAVASADFDGFWDAVDEGIDSEVDNAEVVALDSKRQQEEKARQTDPSGGSDHWFASGYRQGVVGAVAAAALLVTFGALFGDRIFQAQGSGQQKTVVIVDSVEYGSGSSVLVDSPTQQAGAQSADGEDDSRNSAEDADKPTVIWVRDKKPKHKNEKHPDDEDAETRESPESKEGAQPADNPKDGADAGRDSDAGDKQNGQPI